MCDKTAHFLSSCPILAEYTQLGKVSRNVQNLLVLSNSDPISNDLMNLSWAARVDDYYMRNPHLLKDPPLHIQANFAANSALSVIFLHYNHIFICVKCLHIAFQPISAEIIY